MSGICGFGGPDKRFSATEEEAMREDFTTSAVLNKVGKDAGDDGAHVGVRGDDKPWADVKREQHGHFGVAGGIEIGHAAVEGAHIAEIRAIEAATAQGRGRWRSGAARAGTRTASR